MQKQQELYSGKAKTVYLTEDPHLLVLHFRDDTSAFDGEKVEQLARKGKVNNHFNAFVMKKLEAAGIPTHFVTLLSDNESVVKKLTMIPIECIIRNIAAGGISRRLGVHEGLKLKAPIFELFLKNDTLHDPMVNEDHIREFGWATEQELVIMKELTFKVNQVLQKLFKEAGLLLVDFKLEFGRFNGNIVVGDEFSPDGCRIWDEQTYEKLDKDRFRRNLGNVVEAYEDVARRLGVQIPV